MVHYFHTQRTYTSSEDEESIICPDRGRLSDKLREPRQVGREIKTKKEISLLIRRNIRTENGVRPILYFHVTTFSSL